MRASSIWNVGSLAIARGIAQVGLAVSAFAIARRVGVEGLGSYTLLTAIGSVGVGSAAAGAAVFVLRNASRGGRWPLRRLLRLLLVVAGPGVAAVLIAGSFVGTSTSRGAVLAAVVAYLAFGWLTLASASQCGAGRFGAAAAGEAVAGVATPVLTLVSLLLGWGIRGALLSIAAASICGITVMTRQGSEPERRPPEPIPPLRSLVPFILMGSASAGYGRLDAIIVAMTAGETVLGYYGAAYRFLGPLLIVSGSFGTVFFARVSKMSGGISATVRQGRLVLALILVPLALAGALLAPILVKVLYGESFGPAITPARVLLVSAVPLALYWPLAHMLNAVGHERDWTRSLAVATGVNAGVVAVVAPRFGATGAAAAWVGAECLLLLLVAAYTRSIHR